MFYKKNTKTWSQCCGSGSGAFLTPGSMIRVPDGIKIPDRGSGMNNPDHISESLENFLGVE
jgi:hypothetical protein